MECTNLVGPITCCATGLLSYSYYFAYIPSTICSQDRLSTNAEVDLTRIILCPLSALSLDCSDQRERNITTGLFGLTYHVIKKDISFCFFLFFSKFEKCQRNAFGMPDLFIKKHVGVRENPK